LFPHCLIKSRRDRIEVVREEVAVGVQREHSRCVTKHGLDSLDVCPRASYGAVTAVADISLQLRAGQVTCLLGDNGAGKSTLIKMLSGVVTPDSGDIRLGDRVLNGASATEVRQSGIETVYQDLAVCPNLGAATTCPWLVNPQTMVGVDGQSGVLRPRREYR